MSSKQQPTSSSSSVSGETSSMLTALRMMTQAEQNEKILQNQATLAALMSQLPTTSMSSSSSSSAHAAHDTTTVLLTSGDDAFINEQYDYAYELYELALKEDGNNVKVLLHRSAAAIKMKKYVKAEFDAKRAAQLDKTSVLALYRTALALFYQDRYTDSLTSLKKAKRLLTQLLADNSGDENFQRNVGVQMSNIDLWMRKCQAEIQRAQPAATSSPAPAAASTTAATSATKPQAVATATPTSSSSTSTSATTSATSTSSTSAVAPPATATPSQPAVPAAQKVTHSFYQFGADVVVTIFAKGVSQDKVDVHVSNDGSTLSAKVTTPDDSVYTQEWQLYSNVDPATTSLRITAYKLEFSMKKKDNLDWKTLEKPGSASAHAAAKAEKEEAERLAEQKTKLPSAWATKKDWDAVDKEISAEEKSEKPEGDAALQKLFQDIYKGADEDTRRAMIKSYQTSGDTTLSTNWNEVAKTDYETQMDDAPSGMVKKRWTDVQKGK